MWSWFKIRIENYFFKRSKLPIKIQLYFATTVPTVTILSFTTWLIDTHLFLDVLCSMEANSIGLSIWLTKAYMAPRQSWKVLYFSQLQAPAWGGICNSLLEPSLLSSCFNWPGRHNVQFWSGGLQISKVSDHKSWIWDKKFHLFGILWSFCTNVRKQTKLVSLDIVIRNPCIKTPVVVTLLPKKIMMLMK